MTVQTVGVALATGVAGVLLAPPSVSARSEAAEETVRKTATLAVPMPGPGAATSTEFSIRLTRPGTQLALAGSLLVSADHRRLPAGATVLVRLRATRPGRMTVELVAIRRQLWEAPRLARGIDEVAKVSLTVEADRRFALRTREVARWRSSRHFDAPAPFCRSGSPAIRPPFLFLAGQPDPVVEPALAEGSTWASLLPGILCRPSPRSIGILNPAGCTFALDRESGGATSLSGTCASTLRELRISPSSPGAAFEEISLTGPDGEDDDVACRVEQTVLVCPVTQPGPVSVAASLVSPGEWVDVEVVPTDSPRARYRLGVPATPPEPRPGQPAAPRA